LFILGNLTQESIAKKVGVTRETIRDWINHDTEFQNLVDNLLDGAVSDARRTISLATKKAAEKLVELLDSPSETAKQKAAVEILNRAGLMPVERQVIDINQRYTNMSDEELIKMVTQNAPILLENLGGSPPVFGVIKKNKQEEDDEEE